MTDLTKASRRGCLRGTAAAGAFVAAPSILRAQDAFPATRPPAAPISGKKGRWTLF